MHHGFAYADRVASIMDADPAIVYDVLRLSYGQGALFHGVKLGGSVECVKKSGVKPLTPEGGSVSFWTKGIKLFMDPSHSPGSIGETIDCSMTNYSAVRDCPDGMVRSCLVVTDYENLRRYGVGKVVEEYDRDPRPDGTITIGQAVPPCAIDVIDITADASHIDLPQGRGRYRQRTLLYALHKALRTFPEEGRGRLVTRNASGLYVTGPLLQTF